MKLNSLETKRHFVSQKYMIGIDPAKDKHQVMVLDPEGVPMCHSFSFANSYNGFHFKLWQKLNTLPFDVSPENTLFAVENSINFWQKLCFYLSEKGYTVLMVRPVTTKHERPRLNNFSHTDPKDALCIASSARQGYFHFYQTYSDALQGLHRLGITYDKLRKHLVIAKQRLRAEVELLFPEFDGILQLDSQTARYLLTQYLTADDFSKINVFHESLQIVHVSRNHHGIATLKALKETAGKSIGLKLESTSYNAHRISVHFWIEQIQMLKRQQYALLKEMSAQVKMTPYYKVLTSLKGISEVTASRFIAEMPQLENGLHFKQVEAYAGLNLRYIDSGRISSNRRITHWGNHRLRAVLYKMTEETKNHIPEVRIRFLKRQMQKSNYTKNITACTSNLLQLVMALIRDNRCYEFHPEKVKEMEALDQDYQEKKAGKSKRKLIRHAA